MRISSQKFMHRQLWKEWSNWYDDLWDKTYKSHGEEEANRLMEGESFESWLEMLGLLEDE